MVRREPAGARPPGGQVPEAADGGRAAIRALGLELHGAPSKG